jgi:hypothetical protein
MFHADEIGIKEVSASSSTTVLLATITSLCIIKKTSEEFHALS